MDEEIAKANRENSRISYLPTTPPPRNLHGIKVVHLDPSLYSTLERNMGLPGELKSSPLNVRSENDRIQYINSHISASKSQGLEAVSAPETFYRKLETLMFPEDGEEIFAPSGNSRKLER